MHASSLAITAAALVAPVLGQAAPEPTIKGNPFSAPTELNQPTIGKAFEVKWAPTKEIDGKDCSKVKLEVLFGAGASSLVPVTPALADGIDNTGTFSWTPAANLVARNESYGIKLTCAASPYIQYTRLFGLNPAETSSSSTGPPSYETTSSANSTGSSTADATQSSTQSQSTVYTTEVVKHLTTYCPVPTTVAFNQVTYTITSATWLTISDCSCTVTQTAKASTSVPAAPYTPYPIPHNNATTVKPTGYVSPTLKATTTTTMADEPTAEPSMPAGSEGAASGLKATALGAFVAVAVAVLAL